MSRIAKDPRVAPPALLGFLADTLADVAARIERIEALAADMLVSRPRDDDRMIAFQDLDAIRQTVEDLARIAAAAGRGDEHEGPHLATELRLGTLRDSLLSGRHPGEGGRAPESRRAPGIVEFFPIDD